MRTRSGARSSGSAGPKPEHDDTGSGVPGSAWFPTRDGRQLFGERHGAGTPIVVFEAGMGMSRNGWGAIAPAVAAKTTAVIYDRSGLGRSTPDPARRDLDRLSDDLLDVLDNLGQGPFILVGHSWGGPIARAAAATRSEQVAGLVLVDPTDERCDQLLASATNPRQNRLAGWLMPLLARVGLTRLLARRLAARIPEPWGVAMRAEDGTLRSVREQLAELESCGQDLQQLREEPPELPAVPVVIISGTKTGIFERGRRGPLLEAHRASAAALPHGRHVSASNSSHYVPFTDPGVVIAEIEAIVDSTRS